MNPGARGLGNDPGYEDIRRELHDRLFTWFRHCRNCAGMPDRTLARKSSPRVDRAREPSAPRTVRMDRSTSSRAVRVSSMVVYTQPYPCVFSASIVSWSASMRAASWSASRQ